MVSSRFVHSFDKIFHLNLLNAEDTIFYAALLYCTVPECSSILQLEKWTYPGFEGDQFKDHLHSEESSEEHVEDVHGIIEIFGLSMMLQGHINNSLIHKEREFYGSCLKPRL